MGLSNFLGDQAGQAIGGKVGTAISNHYNPDHEQSIAGSLYNKLFGGDNQQTPVTQPATASLAPMPQADQPDTSMLDIDAQPKKSSVGADIFKMFRV